MLSGKGTHSDIRVGTFEGIEGNNCEMEVTRVTTDNKNNKKKVECDMERSNNEQRGKSRESCERNEEKQNRTDGTW